MDDRRTLGNNAKKKITAAMIGALAAFEKEFGKSWGMHKSENEPLTEQEERCYQRWLKVREEILDKGNAQIGAFFQDLEGYNIQKERYRYHYKFMNRREDERDSF